MSFWEWQELRSNDSPSSLLIVAAHPDDETVGIGGILGELKAAELIIVTDGAPRNLCDARTAGCQTREQYAMLRACELNRALQIANVPASRVHQLGFTDQEAAQHLVPLTWAIVEWIERIRPSVVITHPFEGGHPDHDACAFAVRHACQHLESIGQPAPRIFEMASYHAHLGQLRTGEFLGEQNLVSVVELTAHQRRMKQQMFDCYRSQAHVLKYFATDKERLREAPRYDFSQYVQTDPLWYELFSWGITRSDWSELVRQAREQLGRENGWKTVPKLHGCGF